MNVSADILQQIFPRAPLPWLEAIATEAPAAGIDTPNELASFCSQLAVESRELTVFEENLNYSAQRLMQIWPKRFQTIEAAKLCAGNPQKLANYVYANRLGNRDEASGDGWRYRGRGPIQLTGANNYITCGRGIRQALFANPDLLLQPKIGIQSALWYWKSKDLDLLDDDEDVRAETRLINGGEHGLVQRQAFFDRALSVFQAVA